MTASPLVHALALLACFGTSTAATALAQDGPLPPAPSGSTFEQEVGSESTAPIVRPANWTNTVATPWLTAIPLFAGAFTLNRVLPADTPRWTKVGQLDASASRLVAWSGSRRTRIGRTSDVFMFALMALPYAEAAVAGARSGDRTLGFRLSGVSTLSLGFSAFVVSLTKNTLRRERPFGPLCDDDPDYDRHCGTPQQNRGFISGHSAMAFTAAALSCVHTLELDLYGRVPSRVSCGLALGAALVTALLRVGAAQHYPTDVLAGASLGLISGFVLPKLLFYRF